MDLRKPLVEGIGTFFLVFTIGAAVLGAAGDFAPLAIGVVLVALLYMGGHISGAHYNPAVTLAALIRGACTVSDAVPYIIAQLIASAAASACALYVRGGGADIATNIDLWPTMLVEALFTFLLCYVVLNVATAKTTAGNSYFGIAIGFTVMAGAYAVGDVSGGAFNPAAALGFGIMGMVEWAALWPHLAGQIVGAIVSALVFLYVCKDAETESVEVERA